MEPVKDQAAKVREHMVANAGKYEPNPTHGQGEKPKVHSGPMQLREFSSQDYVILADEGVQPADIMREEYWSQRAQELRSFNRIEVRGDDGTWIREVVVLSAGRTWAKVYLLQHYDLTTEDVDRSAAELQDTDYTVTYKGLTRKWTVIRNSDQQPVHEGEQDKGGAQRWLNEHLKAL